MPPTVVINSDKPPHYAKGCEFKEKKDVSNDFICARIREHPICGEMFWYDAFDTYKEDGGILEKPLDSELKGQKEYYHAVLIVGVGYSISVDGEEFRKAQDGGKKDLGWFRKIFCMAFPMQKWMEYMCKGFDVGDVPNNVDPRLTPIAPNKVLGRPDADIKLKKVEKYSKLALDKYNKDNVCALRKPSSSLGSFSRQTSLIIVVGSSMLPFRASICLVFAQRTSMLSCILICMMREGSSIASVLHNFNYSDGYGEINRIWGDLTGCWWSF
ncbi:hypothetical protein RHMOL_Rhmol01G0374800 [Rhododendron molle]|uniref:Uncharacterized protein n=1 Tax=Rhododendron molle TaxID=49168 RepID=A0ACC0QBU3_RHOML|nr:hypothetical protein RHMOL_Rhmol01G0374800 [Rhododendron molle]